MIGEKDIKGFIQFCKPQINDNGKFMSELVRRMDLLPVPSSMERDALSEQQKKQLVSLFSKNLKDNNIRTALGEIALLVALWAIVCVSLYACFADAALFLSSNGIPMSETIIYTLASATFILPAVYILRAL